MSGDRNRGGGLLSGIANGGPLTDRMDKLAVEARHRLDAIEGHLATVAESMERRELRGEAISRIATGIADGATTLEVSIAPPPGALWEISWLAIQADTAAVRNVGVLLGTYPFATIATGNVATQAGIGFLELSGGVVLPPGMPIVARFVPAIAAGVVCAVHIVGRELLVNE